MLYLPDFYLPKVKCAPNVSPDEFTPTGRQFTEPEDFTERDQYAIHRAWSERFVGEAACNVIV
jgi:hypothetical protein